MSPNNAFDREIQNLTQHHGNATNQQFCFSYEPKWYDHGHFARCQVQAKSIYIKKNSTQSNCYEKEFEISAGFETFGGILVLYITGGRIENVRNYLS